MSFCTFEFKPISYLIIVNACIVAIRNNYVLIVNKEIKSTNYYVTCIVYSITIMLKISFTIL